jgi:glycosyltransferase involved in cell wall biosynthesis
MKRNDCMPENSHSDRPGAPPARALAYLVSTYPTLSMTFVLREVLALRELGFQVETASINVPDRPAEELTQAEADEAKCTYYVKQHGLSGAAVAKLQTVFGNFGGYWRGVGLAFRLAGLDLRRLYLNLMYFIEALMVGQWMKRKGLRHLHVHLASQAASVGLFVRTVFGFGYSMTVHGPDEFYDADRQMLAEKIRAADFLCCISAFTRSQLMMLSPYEQWSKFVVSPLGVDAEIFAPRPGRPASEPFEILCVGRLTPAKGQHILIDAVERLMQEGRQVRLRLVGSGPDETSLREHAARSTAAECMVFEGAINQDRIRDFYAAADAFCLPSFAEGLPVVLMEAMAMELPCVTTQIAGIPELIRDGVDGLLVPPSDLDALVKALARLMDNAELREQIGKSGRARVVEHYDLRRSVERLAAIFAERVQS